MEKAYQVLCRQPVAQQLLNSGVVADLERRFHVKIELSHECFSLFRGSSTLPEHQQCKHCLINYIKSLEPVRSKYIWFFSNSVTWVPYEEPISDYIENAFRQHIPCIINFQGQLRNVDPMMMLQSSTDGREHVPLMRRRGAPLPEEQKGQQTYWVYSDLGGVSRTFPREASRVLEQSYRAQEQQVVISLDNTEQLISFQNMTKTDVKTGDTVKVSRVN